MDVKIALRVALNRKSQPNSRDLDKNPPRWQSSPTEGIANKFRTRPDAGFTARDRLNLHSIKRGFHESLSPAQHPLAVDQALEMGNSIAGNPPLAGEGESRANPSLQPVDRPRCS